MENYLDGVDWLHGELERRQDKNSAYSMRAFAKHAGTSPGRMSEYLARKRPLSDKVARRFIDHLATDLKVSFKLKKSILKGAGEGFPVIDHSQVATEWYHYGILSLAETTDFNPDPRAIGGRLGIPTNKVRRALEDLQRAQLISVEDGEIQLLEAQTATVAEVPSAVIRESQKESMRRTIDQLDDIPLALRDISSMTMAIDSGKIPQAKAALKKFRRSLAKLLEAGEQDEVYELNIQFVPITERKN